LIQGAGPRGAAVGPDELRLTREGDDRARERFHVPARDDGSGLAVRHDLGQPADVARDHGAAALRRFERDHAEPLAA